MRIGIWIGAWVCVAAARQPVSAAVVFGQIDDFTDGTTMGWREGSPSPNPPTNVSTGGPNGAGDRYLRNVSIGGSDEGGRMVMMNTGSRWIGNFNSAGVTRIEGFMSNLGTTTLRMRVALTSGSTRFASTTANVLAPGGGWQPVAFDLTASSLTRVQGTGTLATVLGNVTEIRILSSANPHFRGDPIAGTLGTDKLRAMRLRGDANFDGVVDFVDFQRLEVNFGRSTGATWQQGDFNFDGRVNFTDFTVLRSAFGSRLAGEPVPDGQGLAAVEAFGAGVVPEPGGAAVLILGAAAIARRRRSPGKPVIEPAV